MAGGGKTVYWIAITIFCFLIMSIFTLDKFVKKKYNLPNKLKYNKSFNKNQTLIEVLIAIIFIIGAVMSSISVNNSGIYYPLFPVPFYLWISLFMLVSFGFKGYMVKRYAKDSREYYIHFSFAVWTPITIIIAYQAGEIFMK